MTDDKRQRPVALVTGGTRGIGLGIVAIAGGGRMGSCDLRAATIRPTSVRSWTS